MNPKEEIGVDSFRGVGSEFSVSGIAESGIGGLGRLRDPGTSNQHKEYLFCRRRRKS